MTFEQPSFDLEGALWIDVRDADPTVRRIFNRHYSRRRYRRRAPAAKFIGPGEYMALVSPAADAIFVWRKFISMDNQTGINCAVFRNEGPLLSSCLIQAADSLAWARWPAVVRHYTYVNPAKVGSPNPGYCFKCAGWVHVGYTSRGLHVLAIEAQKRGQRER